MIYLSFFKKREKLLKTFDVRTSLSLKEPLDKTWVSILKDGDVIKWKMKIFILQLSNNLIKVEDKIYIYIISFLLFWIGKAKTKIIWPQRSCDVYFEHFIEHKSWPTKLYFMEPHLVWVVGTVLASCISGT